MSDAKHQPADGYTLDAHPFASRGGLKLDAALARSGIDVTGMVCADLGASTGGFVSCLLHRGAKQVYAVDTGYGVLDYGLRTDERVVVMERRNALHVQPPWLVDPPAEARSADHCGGDGVGDGDGGGDVDVDVDGDGVGVGGGGGGGGVDLVTIDLGWTKQEQALAAALNWLKPTGRIITLIKPHYEQPRDTPQRKGKQQPKPEPLSLDASHTITKRVLDAVGSNPLLRLSVLGWCDSPIRGAKGGNLEQLAWLERRA